MKTPLDYGKECCDALMKRYKPEKLPPEGSLFYIQGVFLSGMQHIYSLSGDEKYFNYVKAYVDSTIGKNGELYGFCHELPIPAVAEKTRRALTMLDFKQPAVLMYQLYDKTGEEKYRRVIETIAESMYFWPVNRYGGYWHMMTQPFQMWMDGAYMAGPLSVMYAARFGGDILRDRAIRQIFIMNDFMKDKKTGLYYHGWDDSAAIQGFSPMPWADPVTGLSSQIWGRAVGWYAVAILDMLDYIPKDHPDVPRLKKIECDLLVALPAFQDEKTGMWYNVLDKPGKKGNWVESSCTSLFIYSYAKALRTGILDEKYAPVLEKAYSGLCDSLYYDENGDLTVDNICIGTCIDEGTYEHYIGRERLKNDLHGAGAFIMMCAEMQRLTEQMKREKSDEI